MAIQFAKVDRTFDIRFIDYFALELEELKHNENTDGLLTMSTEGLDATPLGKIFIRNISMVFDRYLREKKRDKPTFSRTV
ncbi:MAG TPA: hypothetical protein EYQ18_19345 [Candidatus Handelsmanbacteria bacterium]|nr:hypothetical protein [Candidatus Handelsmanbacteria bacterium]